MCGVFFCLYLNRKTIDLMITSNVSLAINQSVAKSTSIDYLNPDGNLVIKSNNLTSAYSDLGMDETKLLSFLNEPVKYHYESSDSFYAYFEVWVVL